MAFAMAAGGVETLGQQRKQVQVLARPVGPAAQVEQGPLAKVVTAFFAGFAQRGSQRRLARLGRAFGNVSMPGAGDMAQQQLAGRVDQQDAAGQRLHRRGVAVDGCTARAPTSCQVAAVASALSAMQPQITGP